MAELNQTTLSRLRDRLRERGARPSVSPPSSSLPASALELLQISTEYGPLCEAMYLIMAADGKVLNVEREVLKGALRTLTDDKVKGAHIEAMLDTAAKRLARDGRVKRLEAVIEALRDDPVKAEVAFVVAAAIAMADQSLHETEKEMIDKLAEGLPLPEGRLHEVMKELENDLRK